MSKSWEEIKDWFCKVREMSCRPRDIQIVSKWHIFDADMSVNWNKEQVVLNNERYRGELNRLKEERNREFTMALDCLYEKIREEVEYKISLRQAKIIWDYVSRGGSLRNVDDTFERLLDLIDLLVNLLENK